MISLLWRTEAVYELAKGESLRATNTTEGDLHELFSYGWSAEEAAERSPRRSDCVDRETTSQHSEPDSIGKTRPRLAGFVIRELRGQDESP